MQRRLMKEDSIKLRKLVPTTLMMSLLLLAMAVPFLSPMNAEAAWTLCDNTLPIRSATASGHNLNYPSSAVDGNANTMWANNASGSWIKLDLGDRYVICGVDIAWYMGDVRQSYFSISLSSDDVHYAEVHQGSSSGITENYEENPFFMRNGRYVKITVNGNSQNDFAGILDVRIHGYENTDVTKPAIKITMPTQGSSTSGYLWVQGTTSDNRGGSGVKVVWLKLDDRMYTTAIPSSPDNWSEWSSAFQIDSGGAHKITATVVDKAGNQQWTTVSFNVNTPASDSLTLYDDFSGGTYTLEDGQRSPNGLWKNAYNGWGESGVRTDELTGSNAMYMYSKTSTQLSETHASKVVTSSTYKNFHLSLDMKTVKQLRENDVPNTWETAWLFFRYTDKTHHYYMVLRTNGIELGKKDDSLSQTILYQAYYPRVLMGYYQHIDLQVSGNHIVAYVDGEKAIDLYDSGVSSQLGGAGVIGLYQEDSVAHFDNVRIEPI